MNGITILANLFNGAQTRPSRQGNRKDGKVCDAKPGECRCNDKFYSLGMRDDKSWALPTADDTCLDKCRFLVSIDQLNEIE